MKIAFGFPTLNRPAQAAATKEAARDAGFKIIVDQEERMPRAFSVFMHQLYTFVFNELEADIWLQASDCCRFKAGAADAILRAFDGDLDKVVGCNVTNMPPKADTLEFSFIAVGKDFLARFPSQQLYCPDYWHFYADTELGLYAKEEGKFIFAEEARLELVHPNTGAAPDYTYRMSRVFFKEDTILWRERQSRGWLWGRNFELLSSVPVSMESKTA